MKLVAIDFETYYDDRVSVTQLGAEAYSRHPLAVVYAVALSWRDDNDEIQELALVSDGPIQSEKAYAKLMLQWAMLADKGYTAVAHNASFEEAFLRNKLPAWHQPAEWVDTADLGAYCDQGRSLADVMLNLFGKERDKAIRSAAKGKLPEKGTPAFDEMVEYVSEDSTDSLRIAEKCLRFWPKHERRISQLTLEMGKRGLAVDDERIREATVSLRTLLAETESKIPWRNEDTWPTKFRQRFSEKTGKELKLSPLPAKGSVKALELQAKLDGITLPTTEEGKVTTNKKSDEWADWMKVEENANWEPMKLLSEHRSLNRTLAVVEAIDRRVVDARCRYSLKYFGAHTGRDSGGGGLNLQNLTRDAAGGVKLRKLFCAPAGKQLAVVDLASIEAVVLAYECGNWELYNLYAEGMDFYEAAARALGLYEGQSPMKKFDPNGRNLAKVIVLALGYGMGTDRFQITAGQWGVPLDFEQADHYKDLFHKTFPMVRRFWKKLEGIVLHTDAPWQDVPMPSGRSIRYYGPHRYVDEDGGARWRVRMTPNGLSEGTWGGTLVENYIQALCRDLFMSSILRIVDARPDLLPILRVHDEGVWEVDDAVAEHDLKFLEEQMSISPPWYAGCKIGAEGALVTHYQKI